MKLCEGRLATVTGAGRRPGCAYVPMLAKREPSPGTTCRDMSTLPISFGASK